MRSVSGQSLEDRLTVSFNNPETVSFFCKALYVFFALKIILAAPAIIDILEVAPVKFNDDFIRWLVFLPAWIANENPQVFMAVSVLIILVSVLLPLNYFSGTLIFWIAVNHFRIISSAANGSDLVLMLLLFLSIFLSRWPLAYGKVGMTTQHTVHNITMVLCRVQLVFIYLVSGWDKVQSPMWKSGEALFAISKIDYMVNPNITLELAPETWKLLGWSVIIFELSLPILIWFPFFRIVMIITGIVFHMAIWIWLSLPDFGLIMTIALLIFLKDQDLKCIKSFFRR